MSETLTMERAVDLLDDDHDAGALVPHTPETPDFVDSDAPVPSYAPGLSIEDASKLDFADDAPASERADLVITADHPIAKLDDKLLTLNDLVAGYAAGRDLKDFVYGVDSQYQQVMDAAKAVVQNAEAIVGYLMAHIPPAPDPALSYSNPPEYLQMQAQHDRTYDLITQIVEGGNRARQQIAEVEWQQHANAFDRENRLLMHHFPECGDPEGRERFFDTMRSVAYQCDFSESELRQVVDHRIFRLAHLASLGLAAEQANERKADGRKKQQQKRRARSGNAMERLEQSGSLDDAMAVDFE